MNDVAPAAYLEAEIDKQVRRFPLARDHTFQIGRSEKSNIVLNDDVTSRHHAMLQCSDDGRFYITDLGSSNGTFVNGARASTPLILQSGDKICIGNQEFTFHQDGVAEPPPPDRPDVLKSTNVLFAQSFITVLVMDVRDFTGLAQRIDASKLLLITKTLFREAGKVLQERGAWAQKYIGDAVMAVWLHKKRPPEVHELISIFDSVAQLSGIAQGLQNRFELDLPIQMGAGINTGWASVGNIGSIASADYTALGEVVNKAFRLESATKQLSCDLVLGQETFDFLDSAIETATLFQTHSVMLKGYEKPASAYASHLSVLTAILEQLRQSEPKG